MSEYRTVLDVDGQTTDTVVFRVADSTYIPADPANSDYQQYLAWLAEGNEPEVAEL